MTFGAPGDLENVREIEKPKKKKKKKPSATRTSFLKFQIGP
jgi:hypothetical protein